MIEENSILNQPPKASPFSRLKTASFSLKDLTNSALSVAESLYGAIIMIENVFYYMRDRTEVLGANGVETSTIINTITHDEYSISESKNDDNRIRKIDTKDGKYSFKSYKNRLDEMTLNNDTIEALHNSVTPIRQIFYGLAKSTSHMDSQINMLIGSQKIKKLFSASEEDVELVVKITLYYTHPKLKPQVPSDNTTQRISMTDKLHLAAYIIILKNALEKIEEHNLDFDSLPVIEKTDSAANITEEIDEIKLSGDSSLQEGTDGY